MPNWYFCFSSVSSTNLEIDVDFSNQKSIPMSSSEKDAILIVFKRQNLTNDLTTLVKTNDVLDSLKGNIVKT